MHIDFLAEEFVGKWFCEVKLLSAADQKTCINFHRVPTSRAIASKHERDAAKSRPLPLSDFDFPIVIEHIFMGKITSHSRLSRLALAEADHVPDGARYRELVLVARPTTADTPLACLDCCRAVCSGIPWTGHRVAYDSAR